MSSIDGDEADPTTVIITRGGRGSSRVYHTDEDCWTLGRASSINRTLYRGTVTRYRECKHCSGEANYGTDHAARETCSTCGDTLDTDGTCPFCSRFDQAGGMP